MTSQAQVTPRMAWRARSAVARCSRSRSTTAISPSNSTRSDSGGRTIGDLGPTTDEGDLRNSTGSAGTGLPSSSAWAR